VFRTSPGAQSSKRVPELGQRRIRRIVALIGEDDVPLRALKQELVSLEAQQLALQQELAARDAPAPLIHPNLAEVYRQQVERLHEALQEPASTMKPSS